MICPECNGRGEAIYYVETHRDENSVTVEQRKGICRTCNGRGKKQQTNADRIRAMSDEELAELFDSIVDNGMSCHLICGNLDKCQRNNSIERICKNHYLEWLKQPVED